MCPALKARLRIFFVTMCYGFFRTKAGWWFLTILKNMKVNGKDYSHILWKIKHVGNHQPLENKSLIIDLGATSRTSSHQDPQPPKKNQPQHIFQTSSCPVEANEDLPKSVPRPGGDQRNLQVTGEDEFGHQI